MEMLAKLDNKLDDLGRPAWIALMVLGFIVFWPIGLGLLAYLIWSGRMGCSKGNHGRWQRRGGARWRDEAMRFGGFNRASMRTSGNHAFDEYREETLKRLEEEQKEFSDYLERLRMAKDKAEFDQFMAERRQPVTSPDSSSGAADHPSRSSQ